MYKSIRKSCFETNSSSTHSVTISAIEDMSQTLEVNENGKVVIHAGYFPNFFSNANQNLIEAKDKASYALTVAIDNKDLKCHLPSGKECSPIELLEFIILQNTEAFDVEFRSPQRQTKLYDKNKNEFIPKYDYGDDSNEGYIDDLFSECINIFKSPEILKNFLFNKNSYVEIHPG